MKLKLTLLFFGLMAAASLPAAESAPDRLTVAVYDFKGGAEVANFGSKVTALVTADLTSQTNLIMVERAELKKAISEQAFGASGMVSSDAAAKVGQITGAKVLVSGQVIKLSHDRVTVVANIIGTETGRLFATKVEGASDDLTGLASDLSSNIAQTIAVQSTNLTRPSPETGAARLERIVKNIKGTNRPSVAVDILWGSNKRNHCNAAEVEFGVVLLKAGFQVVDANSDRKPDVEIKGIFDHSEGPRHGELFSDRAVIELRAHDRRTGGIIAFDREEGIANDATRIGADRAAQVLAVDNLAERLLPVLAK